MFDIVESIRRRDLNVISKMIAIARQKYSDNIIRNAAINDGFLYEQLATLSSPIENNANPTSAENQTCNVDLSILHLEESALKNNSKNNLNSTRAYIKNLKDIRELLKCLSCSMAHTQKI